MIDLEKINNKLVEQDKEFIDLSSINSEEIIDFIYKVKKI